MRQTTIVLAILGIAIVRGGAAPSKPVVKWPSLSEIKSGSGEPLEKAGMSPAELRGVRAALNDLVNGKGCQGQTFKAAMLRKACFSQR
jgi:hypothetical protein